MLRIFKIFTLEIEWILYFSMNLWKKWFIAENFLHKLIEKIYGWTTQRRRFWMIVNTVCRFTCVALVVPWLYQQLIWRISLASNRYTYFSISYHISLFIKMISWHVKIFVKKPNDFTMAKVTGPEMFEFTTCWGHDPAIFWVLKSRWSIHRCTNTISCYKNARSSYGFFYLLPKKSNWATDEKYKNYIF